MYYPWPGYWAPTYPYYNALPRAVAPWPYHAAPNSIQPSWTMPPAPPGSAGHLRGGMDPASTYLFPEETTTVKVILGEAWAPGAGTTAQGGDTRFSFYTVPPSVTVNELIERVGGRKGWLMTELYERGGGNFVKGIEIAQGSDGGKKSLKGCGFERRNVFVWIHAPVKS